MADAMMPALQIPEVSGPILTTEWAIDLCYIERAEAGIDVPAQVLTTPHLCKRRGMASSTQSQNPLARKSLTVERLKELLYYDPDTGAFTRRALAGSRGIPGTQPGYHKPDGYIIISIDRRQYRAHRLAWLYITGEWPAREIDHKNLVRNDNRWSNLREATHAQNNQNRKAHRDSRSGFKGVSFCKDTGKWRARINVNKRPNEIGRFDTAEAAVAACAVAIALLHGDFARVE